MSSYMHVVNGRLRIKVLEVKRAPLKASEVVETLWRLHGVTHVQANPTTGSVLVLFQPEVVNLERIVQTLKDVGCLSNSPASIPQSASFPGQKLAEKILQTAFETALQQVIVALI